MYDLPIVPPPVHRGRVRVEEAELDEVYHNVEESASYDTNTEPNWLWVGSIVFIHGCWSINFLHAWTRTWLWGT
ncbi:hypothetical protein E5676_scaffold222G00100 [Cucumis melo var. makuwa]|uniref:Uncharacterized protein n=1 Tax=Cucumis melo var. makuwa TaxID=1194695 RepID=A0A5D3BGC8_CUCMM|nr:hypothetical protein E5676_scaffold222G00100 [Cucumis melo var. makuwa]